MAKMGYWVMAMVVTSWLVLYSAVWAIDANYGYEYWDGGIHAPNEDEVHKFVWDNNVEFVQAKSGRVSNSSTDEGCPCLVPGCP